MKFSLEETITIEEVPARSVPGLILFYSGSHEHAHTINTHPVEGLVTLILKRFKTWERPAAPVPVTESVKKGWWPH